MNLGKVMQSYNYYSEGVRETLCWWLLLIASLIWEWTNDYLYSPECFSERFFTSLEPQWQRYGTKVSIFNDDTDSDDIPF